jgi:hypothetical protein
VIHLHCSPKTIVVFQYISWTNFVSVNFRHVSEPRQKVDEKLLYLIS